MISTSLEEIVFSHIVQFLSYNDELFPYFFWILSFLAVLFLDSMKILMGSGRADNNLNGATILKSAWEVASSR